MDIFQYIIIIIFFQLDISIHPYLEFGNLVSIIFHLINQDCIAYSLGSVLQLSYVTPLGG